MRHSAPPALFLIFSLVISVAAQDAAALDALFRQAVQAEASNPAEASRLYDQAARQGHTPSMVRLGYMRLSGAGGPQSDERAFALFNQAAQAGDLDGEFMLGMSYLQGRGTAKNPTRGRELLLQPAAKGNQFAQYTLGVMLESGDGGPKREAAARRWLDRAAGGPDRTLAAKAADIRDKIDAKIFATDNSTAVLLEALFFVALVGSAMGGGNGGGSVPSTSSPQGGFAGSSKSSPPCHMHPVNTLKPFTTPNGADLTASSTQWVCD